MIKSARIMASALAALLLAAGLSACSSPVEKAKEVTSGYSKEADFDENSLQSPAFKPPRGSRIDSRGYYVDPEGNTYDKEGGWQVPAGGHADSAGHVYDANGRKMYGGAKIGTKG